MSQWVWLMLTDLGLSLVHFFVFPVEMKSLALVRADEFRGFMRAPNLASVRGVWLQCRLYDTTHQVASAQKVHFHFLRSRKKPPRPCKSHEHGDSLWVNISTFLFFLVRFLETSSKADLLELESFSRYQKRSKRNEIKENPETDSIWNGVTTHNGGVKVSLICNLFTKFLW